MGRRSDFSPALFELFTRPTPALAFFFFSSRRRHTRCLSDWSSDVCSSDLGFLPITRLAVVREEAAAYPVISGPRTLFEVDTPRARLSLTFQHRSRRWTVTGLDEGVRTAA